MQHVTVVAAFGSRQQHILEHVSILHLGKEDSFSVTGPSSHPRRRRQRYIQGDRMLTASVSNPVGGDCGDCQQNSASLWGESESISSSLVSTR